MNVPDHSAPAVESTSAPRRKLIEVSLPLEDINRESAREKSIRHGHPSTLHLWWARRPLASARAVLFAQLVDDPSSHPEKFPTEEAQKLERERLHNIIRRLVVWENINDEKLLAEAHAEIMASTGNNPPAILDPFAGGGTIPLEAQRLGLEAHASDLNPVAVLINKALIEIPPKFAGQAPVFPGAADERMGDWPRATGLAEDVRRYGAWMRDRAQELIGHLYPKATIVDEKTGSKTEATVIAWIWARTVTCPNPACAIEMPLVKSWWLGKKKGKEAYVVPEIVPDDVAPSGRRVAFSVGHDKAGAPRVAEDGTVGRTGATCVACGAAAPLKYIRGEGMDRRLGTQLLAIVAEGNRRRLYLPPSEWHLRTAQTPAPRDVPREAIGHYPRDIKAPIYGMQTFADLFTSRQLTALTTLSDLVGEAREQVLKDALAAGLPNGDRLTAGGTDAAAYADAVATYLAFAISRTTNKSTAICSWDSSPKMEAVRGLFARQAIPMAWDFAEANPFGGSSGDFIEDLKWVRLSLEKIPATTPPGLAVQADAATRNYSSRLISTDPPYYDNIGYSDLSDFFYVWLRRSLRATHPDIFSTMLVPKAEELVANPYRHDGKDGAARFFEEGFEHVFARARESALDDFPITVYYAFKQQELESEGVASTGWSTLLEGMIRSGWTITATWPMRTELGNRMMATGMNALASSIVLSLRPRHETATPTSRRGFLAALKSELPQALSEMQQGAIAPVDLAQSTIGPGMAIFSRYSQVLENDGKPMTVKTALMLINQVLDEVLAENDGDLDTDSRFCLKWYLQYGWAVAPYGEADVLAKATNTSVEGLRSAGVLKSGENKVRLVRPADLPSSWNPARDDRISVWEVACHLARVLSDEQGGVEPAARLLAATRDRGDVDLEAVQLLAYRLYELTQDKRPEDARLFNALGGAWAELNDLAQKIEPTASLQDAFDLGDD
jgi:putative DNA methylase